MYQEGRAEPGASVAGRPLVNRGFDTLDALGRGRGGCDGSELDALGLALSVRGARARSQGRLRVVIFATAARALAILLGGGRLGRRHGRPQLISLVGIGFRVLLITLERELLVLILLLPIIFVVRVRKGRQLNALCPVGSGKE